MALAVTRIIDSAPRRPHGVKTRMKDMTDMNEVEPFEADEDLFAETSDVEPEPYPDEQGREREVVTTPIDPDVRTILGQLKDKSLILRPDFQRLTVWERSRQSRLIESLLLNIPIPPCFFAEDPEGTRVVVDGQQRLRAIDEFCRGQYRLRGLEVRSDLNGKKWDNIPAGDTRKILRRVFRTIIISHYSDPDIKFEIFRRLNTGGVPLTEQEIRNAIYRGPFNRLLDRLARDPLLLKNLRRKEPDKRLRHHELVLRYFALSDALENFKPPLKKVLNEYMKGEKRASRAKLGRLERKFRHALEVATSVFGDNVFRRFTEFENGTKDYESVVSKAVFDLQMIGLGDLSEAAVENRAADVRTAFERLSVEDDEFNDLLSRATDHRYRFYSRMKRWADTLKQLGLKTDLAKRMPPKSKWR